MKLYILLLFCHIYVVWSTVPRALPHSVPLFRASTPCSTPKFSCTSDCTNLTFCFGTIDEQMNCQDDFGLTYCDPTTNTCTNKKPTNCETPKSSFMCPSPDGTFPDPDNCKKYYMCIENEGYHFECTSTTNYDHKNRACRPGVQCYNFLKSGLCRWNLGKFVAYPPAKELYALCTKTKAYMLKCEKVNWVFDAVVGKCVFGCPKVGRFAHDDGESFYDCYLDRNVLKYNVITCPGGLVFDGTGCGRVITVSGVPTTSMKPTTL